MGWDAYGDARLVEVSSMPVRYVHGAARVFIIEPNVHVIYFKFERLRGELVKVPVWEMIRPLSVDIGAQIRAMIQVERAAAIESRLPRH